jgi:hypothetical protein
VRLTPIVVESYRPEGKAPKHRTIWRPGFGIRQCCVKDHETIDRISFWCRLEHAWTSHVETLEEQCKNGTIPDFEVQRFTNAREAIFAQVGRVVPMWTQADRDLYEFCFFGFLYGTSPGESDLEKDRRIYRQAAARRDDWYANRRPGEWFDEYQARKAARSNPGQAKQASDQSAGGFGGVVWFTLEVQGAPCWGVLDLTWPATADQVGKSYRRLALQHHPDRGGNASDFRRATEAKNQALKFIDRYEALTGRKAG